MVGFCLIKKPKIFMDSNVEISDCFLVFFSGLVLCLQFSKTGFVIDSYEIKYYRQYYILHFRCPIKKFKLKGFFGIFYHIYFEIFPIFSPFFCEKNRFAPICCRNNFGGKLVHCWKSNQQTRKFSEYFLGKILRIQIF